jgi:hypothetical protein
LKKEIGKAEKSRLERLTAQDQATVGRMKRLPSVTLKRGRCLSSKLLQWSSLSRPRTRRFFSKNRRYPDAVLAKNDEIASKTLNKR